MLKRTLAMFGMLTAILTALAAIAISAKAGESQTGRVSAFWTFDPTQLNSEDVNVRFTVTHPL